MENEFKKILKNIEQLPINEKIEKINKIKILLHQISPFKGEPGMRSKTIKLSARHAGKSIEELSNYLNDEEE